MGQKAYLLMAEHAIPTNLIPFVSKKKSLQMKKIVYAYLSILLLLINGCNNDSPSPAGDTQQITGTWLLTETSYSIGGPLIKEPVAAMPPQLIAFKSDNTISSTLKGFNLKFYKLTVDTTYQQKVVTFYDQDPTKMSDETGSSYGYFIDDSGRSMEMGFRWCTEGCGMSFNRIE